jgi:hypothetical protein
MVPQHTRSPGPLMLKGTAQLWPSEDAMRAGARFVSTAVGDGVSDADTAADPVPTTVLIAAVIEPFPNSAPRLVPKQNIFELG